MSFSTDLLDSVLDYVRNEMTDEEYLEHHKIGMKRAEEHEKLFREYEASGIGSTYRLSADWHTEQLKGASVPNAVSAPSFLISPQSVEYGNDSILFMINEDIENKQCLKAEDNFALAA